jgi:hypothetical protein
MLNSQAYSYCKKKALMSLIDSKMLFVHLLNSFLPLLSLWLIYRQLKQILSARIIKPVRTECISRQSAWR